MYRSRDAALGWRSPGSSRLPKTPRGRKEERSTSTCCRARSAARDTPDSAPPSLLCLTVGVCSPQLWSSEEAKQKVSVRLTDSAAEEKFQQMQKEINEQERLLKGYQQVSSSSVPASPLLGGLTLT